MDVLLRRARLGGLVQNVLVSDGRVAAVAPELTHSAVWAGRGRSSRREVVDLDGAVVLPGLRDEHVHLKRWAAARRRLDVSRAGSAAEAVALVAQALARRPDDATPVVGAQGFRDALWSDAPALAVLDAAVADQPVVLVSADLHTAWCNTRAMHRLGLQHSVVREDEAMSVLTEAGPGRPCRDG